ncbi:HslV family protein [Salmonella phage SPAsTU]|nr:HslV family protein [Salmonella phage SPAsTU]
MTTIAFDGNTLASDSQLTAGTLRLDSNTKKIYRPESNEQWVVDGKRAIAFGVAGSLGATEIVHGALRSVMVGYSGLNSTTRFIKGESLKYIVITESGEVYAGGQYSDEEIPWLAKVQPPIAVGSGSEYAMGAMAAGVSAAEAVRIAMHFDVNTGGPVQEIVIVPET